MLPECEITALGRSRQLCPIEVHGQTGSDGEESVSGTILDVSVSWAWSAKSLLQPTKAGNAKSVRSNCSAGSCRIRLLIVIFGKNHREVLDLLLWKGSNIDFLHDILNRE